VEIPGHQRYPYANATRGNIAVDLKLPQAPDEAGSA